MSNDDSTASSTGSGGWSTYKRLILHMLEDLSKDIRLLMPLLERVSGLEKWTGDINERVEKAQLSSLLSRLRAIDEKIQHLERGGSSGDVMVTGAGRSNADRNPPPGHQSRDYPSPGLLLEIWRHPLGKVLASLMALAAVLGAGAAYNAVSIAQVDINQHLRVEEVRSATRGAAEPSEVIETPRTEEQHP